LSLLVISFFAGGCGSKEDVATEKPAEKIREAVKDVVTHDFKTLESARDALKQSEEKAKTALEALDKESK
jgi:hypothetical protein